MILLWPVPLLVADTFKAVQFDMISHLATALDYTAAISNMRVDVCLYYAVIIMYLHAKIDF